MTTMPAIQPMQLPQGIEIPKIDFAPLGSLISDYQQNKLNQMKLGQEQNKQKAMASLGNPGADPDAMIKAGYAIMPYDASAGAAMVKAGIELKSEAATAASLPKPGGSAWPQQAPQAPQAPPAPAVTPPAAPTGPTSSLSIPAVPGPTLANAQPTPPPPPPPIPTPPAPPAPAFARADTPGYAAAPDKKTVRFEGVNQELLQTANAVGNELQGVLGRPLHVTSARDSTHTDGSLHYTGGALDLRTRDLNPMQRQAIVSRFKARGLTAVDEGDHIHVATPRGGSAPLDASPGTVVASLQNRGPTSVGSSGAAVRTAAVDQNYLTPASTMSDASPISAVPMARTSESPASVTNPGGSQTEQSPDPVPAVAPSLAAPRTAEIQPGLGIPPLGTDAPAAPPILPRPIQPPADPVQAQQVAQATAIPLPPARPPAVAQAPPAVAPQPQPAPTVPAPAAAPQGGRLTEQQVAATGPYPDMNAQQLIAIAGRIKSTSAYAGTRDAMLKEVERRSKILGEQLETAKPSAEYTNFLRFKESNPSYKGDWLQYQQDLKSDVSKKRLYDAVVAEQGKYPGGLAQFLKDTSGATSVTVDMKGDTAQAVQVAKDDAEAFKNYQVAGRNAQTSMGTVGVLRAAMKDPNFYSGKGASVDLFVKQLRDAIGLKPGEASNAGPQELFRAYSYKSIVDELGGLGAGVSNADVQFLGQVATSLEHSKGGNRMLIAVKEAMYERAQTLARMAREYKKNNGNKFDSGFDDVAADYAAKNPLITSEALEKAARGDAPVAPVRQQVIDAMKRYQ